MQEFSYAINTHTCEGIADCIPVCPTECMHWSSTLNDKGTKHVYIDAAKCINCGACLSVCPIEGAIQDEWDPGLQKEAGRKTYSTFDPAWRTEAVVGLARALASGDRSASLAVLADALEDAGCDDARLLDYCRRSDSPAAGKWVASVMLD